MCYNVLRSRTAKHVLMFTRNVNAHTKRAVAFFNLENGLKLALWPRKSMAIDNGLAVDPPSSTEMLIGHNVDSPAEVDAAMRDVEKAGATIVKAAHKTFYGGYSGSFKDPDWHLWEVVHVPNFDDLG